MDNTNVIITGDIAKTVTCNVTGNAVVFEEMDNMTEGNNITENMKTFNVAGKILLIKDIGNMTEKAVMIGKMDNMPGNVVIFGEREIIEGMDDMDYITKNMDNMNVIMTGNMTGTITFDMTEDMGNVTENMNNRTGFVTGNMTGTVTGDMTRKMVVIRNIGPIAEMVTKVCNMTWTAADKDNMTVPTACNITGKMVIIKTMDDMNVMDEGMNDMVEMGGNTAILEKMNNIAEMNESRDKTTGKIIIVQKMDDMIKIVTRPIELNATERTTIIEKME
ncbi:STARP antigen [Methanosarcina sp. WH1]|nr:STARP antigen [Methanosarcina sp. WH1]